MQWRNVRITNIWILPALIIFICWLVFILLPVSESTSPLVIPWLSLPRSYKADLEFQLTPLNWPLVFMVISLNLAYFLTMPSRLESEKRTMIWIGWLLLSTLTMVSLCAGNIISLIFSWTCIDLVDFSYLHIFVSNVKSDRVTTSNYSSRILAIVFLILALVTSTDGSGNLTSDVDNMTRSILLFIAAILQTNVLPIRSKTENDCNDDNFPFFLSKIIPVLTGSSLLANLPVNIFPELWNQVFSYLLIILAIFALLYKSILKGILSRGNWDLVIVVLSLTSFLMGNSKLAISWAVIFVVLEGMLTLYTLRHRNLMAFHILCIISFSGLPYTIGLPGVGYQITSANSIIGIVTLILFSILAIQYFNEAKRLKDNFLEIRTHYQASYLFGLFLFSISPVIIAVKSSFSLVESINYWWIAVIYLVLVLIGLLLTKKFSFEKILIKINVIQGAMSLVENFLQFKWISVFWQWIYSIFHELIDLLTQMLEGEGGVIWTFVLLVLFLSLLAARGYG